jgi:uncharacterized protein (DUF488 family)
MDRILTIGVYGWTAEAWLAALRQAGCDVVVDIRARRGVRGRESAFANRSRLETALSEAGVGYVHLPDLAPSRTTRDTQVAADISSGTAKRDRSGLHPAFADAYLAEVAGRTDWHAVAAAIPGTAPALLCVERLPSACHRSLAAAELARIASVPVQDLVP